MNDDYLWDRTGEPDKEIQELEEVLGALRYQPKALKIPEEQLRSSWSVPKMAIAAALATILVGASSWLMFSRRSATGDHKSVATAPTEKALKAQPENSVTPAKDPAAESPIASSETQNKRRAGGMQKVMVAGNKRARRSKSAGSELTGKDLADARAAKEQLLLALRVASAKLSLAQKKAQGGYPGNLIRNQHKVG
jgi:hypothetical protein